MPWWSGRLKSSVKVESKRLEWQKAKITSGRDRTRPGALGRSLLPGRERGCL